MASKDLYPEIEPFDTGLLPLGGPTADGVHQMYYEQSGNPKGVPVVFLHGGPGAGANATHRRFFDPSHYRIVVFDQRGSGRSKPLGEIRDNTTPLLVEDIEKLRKHLSIEAWFVFGGSWGSTLAIAYAESHPDRVRGMALRGIFLCRKSEIDWFLYGIRTVYPEPWRAFAEFLPPEERHDLLHSYYRRLIDPDPAVHLPAARAWSLYEGACSTLLPSPDTVAAFGEDRMALGLSRIEAHYFIHNLYTPETDLVAQVGRVRHLPATIVQGRYDMVCPIVSADELARAWPEAEYLIVPDAGHSAMEPSIRTRLVATMERMKRLA